MSKLDPSTKSGQEALKALSDLITDQIADPSIGFALFVFDADSDGFTSLLSDCDPEEVYLFVHAFLARMKSRTEKPVHQEVFYPKPPGAKTH